jgi:hypothetical protein
MGRQQSEIIYPIPDEVVWDGNLGTRPLIRYGQFRSLSSIACHLLTVVMQVTRNGFWPCVFSHIVLDHATAFLPPPPCGFVPHLLVMVFFACSWPSNHCMLVPRYRTCFHRYCEFCGSGMQSVHYLGLVWC